jgi:hypothetical protein
MMKRGLNLIISFCAIGVSIVAICTSLNSFCISETAYLGWIVAVLSTLVVVLIGWQIYSVIDFRALAKNLESLQGHVDNLIEDTGAKTGMALSDYYYHMVTGDKRDFEFKYLNYSIMAIAHASRTKDIATCNAIVKSMIDAIVTPENIKLSKKNKGIIFDGVSQVKYGNEIEQYGELLQKIARLADL